MSKRRKCYECGAMTLIIDGVGDYNDTILVHCDECGMEGELEPDGLGEGGFEMLEALEIETQNGREDDA